MRYIPTERDLNQKVKLISIMVSGQYLARIDERRKTSRPYKVEVLVPEKFTKSDIKRQTPKTLLEHKDFGDFVAIRTYDEDRKTIKKTDKSIARRELYSLRELQRFEKLRAEEDRERKLEMGERKVKNRGGVLVGDTSEYGDDGLPPVVNDD